MSVPAHSPSHTIWSPRRDRHACPRAVIAIVAVLSCATGAMAGVPGTATITSMGVLPDGVDSRALSVSDDGSVVVGSGVQGGHNRAIRWTRAGGPQSIGALPGGNPARAFGVSADGAVVTGWSDSASGVRAIRWTSAGGMQSLGLLASANRSQGFGLSADGGVIVGLAVFPVGPSRGFRWTAAGGMQDIGDLPGETGQDSACNAVSDDGATIVGGVISTAGPRAFRWFNGSMQSLGVLPGGTSSTAFGISGDGATIVGRSGSTPTSGQAFRWRAADGMQALGILPGHHTSAGYTSSTNGELVIGWSESSDSASGHRAFAWTESMGMQDLGALLSARGADLNGWILNVATDMSGVSGGVVTIVGYGSLNGESRGFIAELMHPCMHEPDLFASLLGADSDGDGYCSVATGGTDCGDTSPGVLPGATETCVTDGTDNDCDGDAYDADDAQTFYLDADGDGAGASDATIIGCSAPPGYVAVAGDGCPLNPFALAPIRWYRDADVDAFGDRYASMLACSQPAGYIPESTDCDDTRADVNPSAPEVCDAANRDEDCDGYADDADASATGKTPWYVDGDGDSIGAGAATASCDAPSASHVASGNDCADGDASRYPGAVELCATVGTDNDCDGDAADTDTGTPDGTTFFGDSDGDGYGDAAVTVVACSPPAGFATNSLDRCPGTGLLRDPVRYYVDADGDGFGGAAVAEFCQTSPPAGHNAASTDCDDLRPAVNPSAQEVCDAYDRDEDCDGVADDADASATGQTPWYLDQDGDGFGDPADSAPACDQPAGRVGNAGDGCPTVAALGAPVTYHFDGDGDGYGGSSTVQLCATSAPDRYTGGADDCNDANALIHAPVRYYADTDGDGAGDPESYVDACDLYAPAGYVSAGTDGCPQDAQKLAPGDCGCGAPDSDADGDGTSDCIDATPALRLVAAGSGTFAGGAPVVVHAEVSARLASQPTVGAQVVVRYDTTKLAFVGAAPGQGAGGVFSEQISLSHNAAAGVVLYAVGVDDSSSGSTAAGRVCTLTFALAPGATAICAEAGLVQFAVEGEITSRLTMPDGDPIYPTEVDLGPIRAFAGTPSLSGVPESWERPADAGIAGSVFAQPQVFIATGCGTVSAAVTVTLPGGSASASWPLGGVFPVGTTTVTWSAAALPGLPALTATRTFTVLNAQRLLLTASLEGALIAPSVRTVRVSAGASVQTVTMTLGGATAPATAEVLVPLTLAPPCVEAKDPVHSLTSAAQASMSGVSYAATVSLRQGDSNDDDAVDILDFGVLVGDIGIVAPSARSNFNGDGVANTVDFSFISFNFFREGQSCGGGLADGSPASRVSVAQLRKLGCGDLAVADLNRDGWLDTADIALWMQGARPAEHAGDPASDGPAAE